MTEPTNNNLPAEIKALESPSDVEAYKQDFAYVRANLYDLIDKGKLAIDDLISLSNQMQHPRSYEVLASFITQITKANRDLLEMRQMFHDSNNKGAPSSITNNNLFVGSTAELLQQLKEINNQKSDSENTIDTDYVSVPTFDSGKKDEDDKKE